MAGDILELLKKGFDKDSFRSLHWSGSFNDYLEMCRKKPEITRNAYQRLYDMILSYGYEEVQDHRDHVVRYKFFADPLSNGHDAIFGLDKPVARFVNILKSAAQGYGTEKRVLLLHGPVGSAKSTMARLLKRGVEAYSRIDAGAIYSFGWKVVEDGVEKFEKCPMHEEPLKLIPEEMRAAVEEQINKDNGGHQVVIRGDICPFCRYYFQTLMEQHGGDVGKVIDQIRVYRLVLSEKDRIGIGTFQPKDEKNQDSTDLTGDLNYRKIAEYGSDSDPRAFNFDGEFNVANRGIVEFIEVLKLDVAFLYDLLGASQEHTIKPKKFSQTDIDEVILGHTNEPEYKKLASNELMEAFRDRTVKIDVPYCLTLSDEMKIYNRDFNTKSVKKHIAPHTIEVAAMWAILTRLEEPKKANLTLIQKLRLYDGKSMPGYTEDTVAEMMQAAKHEGLSGISPRYIQDKVSNALVVMDHVNCIHPFMVFTELEEGLWHHSLITSDQQRQRYKELLAMVRSEYEEMVKNEVQRAICADEDAIAKLCQNYIDNIKAYTQREKIRNKFTHEAEEPDERLMRSIEEKIDIPEARKEVFRGEIMNYIGALALEGRKFDYRTNDRLRRALELKLFEDQKDALNLSGVLTDVVDRETQEKIDVVKTRMIKAMGYCEICATDVLNYVASIFARGDTKEEE
ncbi:MAG: PrkA family serine protein kinase [Planctomycetota bacterium]